MVFGERNVLLDPSTKIAEPFSSRLEIVISPLAILFTVNTDQPFAFLLVFPKRKSPFSRRLIATSLPVLHRASWPSAVAGHIILVPKGAWMVDLSTPSGMDSPRDSSLPFSES